MNNDAMPLRASSITRAQLRDVDVAHMYALYSTCYRDTEQARFEHDLDDKTHCVIMRDDTGKLRGFSTLKLYEQQWGDTALRILFSGDTIVDPACWGSQQLAFCWIRLAGELKRNSPDRALYWFLICKGHRTYRYLRAFAHDFTPRFDRPAEPLRQALLDHLAVERFGHAYDAASGVLNFPTPQGRLAPALAEVPDAHRRLPDVAYFLERNPEYAHGNELVCLCELTPENLRPMARRIFTGE